MRSANVYFITLGLSGAFAAALFFGDSTALRQKTVDAFQSLAEPFSTKGQAAERQPTAAEVLRSLRAEASEPIAAHMVHRQVRLPAIQDGCNYGWIQLPRGTFVDLVRNEGNTLLIRYDELTVRMPQSAVEEGAVILRNPKAALTRI